MAWALLVISPLFFAAGCGDDGDDDDEVTVQYTLTINTPTGGTITASPASADGKYDEGTVVTLTAAPTDSAAMMFEAWSGDASGTTSPTTITMNADKTVGCTFTEVPDETYTLTVTTPTNGTITLDPATGPYAAGTEVTVTAAASNGYMFTGWTGDLSGSTNPSAITMNEDKTIGATFVDANTGTYKLVVEGFDWGPAVTKVILTLEEAVTAAEVGADDFTVSVSMSSWGTPTVAERDVTDAYTSDANGNEVTTNSQYVTIEMPVHPSLSAGSPFSYDFASGRNSWADPYDYEIVSSSLTIMASEFTGRISPVADLFAMDTHVYTDTTHGEITLHYATFDPASDAGTNPLVIWLHGAGEGGTDPYITLLGNKVVNLASTEIQTIFGGAYILAPQAPTMWMDNGTGAYSTDGTSMFSNALMDLITTYVSGNADIDPNRVYIGGCSNGGFMTMRMIIDNPTYFAAAYPICEALADENITADNINAIKDLPIWFTHSENDSTVGITQCSLTDYTTWGVTWNDADGNALADQTQRVHIEDYTRAAYRRLIAAGATDVHWSYFGYVTDTSGEVFQANGTTPYNYMGHWSWLYTLNNECTQWYTDPDKNAADATAFVDSGTTIMEWLASKSK